MQMQSNNRYVGNVTVTTTSILLKLWQVVVLIAFAGDLGGFILVAAVMFQESLEEEARTAVGSS